MHEIRSAQPGTESRQLVERAHATMVTSTACGHVSVYSARVIAASASTSLMSCSNVGHAHDDVGYAASARRAARPRASRRPRSWRTTRRRCAAPGACARDRRARDRAGSTTLRRARPVWSANRWRGRRRPSGSSKRVGQRLVQHHRTEVEVPVEQRRAELLGLVQRRRFERGDDRERRAAVVQQPLDRLRALDESRVHRLEVEEELRDVLEELAARARGRRVGRRAGWRC